MILLLADENFNNNIVRGLIRRLPSLDIVRIQDVGLSGEEDPVVLEWAARENRILLTHDISTITFFANERIKSGRLMPGVFEVDPFASIGRVIEDIILLVELSYEDEWKSKIGFLPLK